MYLCITRLDRRRNAGWAQTLKMIHSPTSQVICSVRSYSRTVKFTVAGAGVQAMLPYGAGVEGYLQ